MNACPPIGILLAAGVGSRFCPTGSTDKLLARLPDGTPVALASLRALQPVVQHVLAIVRPQAAELAALLSAQGATVLCCPLAAQGMGTSLAFAAVHCTHRLAPVLVALADMPWIRPQTMQMIAAALSGSHIVAPAYEGQRGHPVGFPARLVDQLATLHGDVGACGLLLSNDVLELDCGDPAILSDVDHPQDLLHGKLLHA